MAWRVFAKYIEQITQKTGNLKALLVFAKMSACSGPKQETVFVDLLTYNDLEMLKSRKMGKPRHRSNARYRCPLFGGSGGAGNKKKYLILTYAVEFDRVLPLPLAFESELRRVIEADGATLEERGRKREVLSGKRDGKQNAGDARTS